MNTDILGEKLEKMNPKNYGFLEPTIVTEGPKAHYFGGQGLVPQVPVLQADADWDDAVIQEFDHEQVTPFFDPCNCTAEGLAHQLEEVLFIKYGIKKKVSVRWIGIIAGTRPPGNDPQTVYEAVRKQGFIFDELLPVTADLKSVEEYFSFKGSDEAKCREAAAQSLRDWKFMHEWVFSENDPREVKIQKMRVAYPLSPFSGAFSAWYKDDRGLYVTGSSLNHWVNTLGLTTETYQKGRDSYIPFRKLIDQEPHFVKRIHLERISGTSTQNRIWVLDLFKSLLEAVTDLLKLSPTPQNIETIKNSIELVKEHIPEAVQPIVAPVGFQWETPAKAEVSVRKIADEEGLSADLKEKLCKTIKCESGFNNKAKNENKDGTRVLSTDFGICQINDYWHIGPKKTFPSVQYVLDNPEAVVRWMCKMFKAGKPHLWVCYQKLFKK